MSCVLCLQQPADFAIVPCQQPSRARARVWLRLFFFRSIVSVRTNAQTQPSARLQLRWPRGLLRRVPAESRLGIVPGVPLPGHRASEGFLSRRSAPKCFGGSGPSGSEGSRAEGAAWPAPGACAPGHCVRRCGEAWETNVYTPPRKHVSYRGAVLTCLAAVYRPAFLQVVRCRSHRKVDDALSGPGRHVHR